MNPLLIDLIFEKIVEYLDIKTIKSARLVCSKWEIETTDSFLCKTQIDPTRLKTIQYEEFLSTLKSRACLPYKNIALHIGAEYPNSSALRTIFDFIRPLRDSVTSVHFYAWRVPCEYDYLLGKEKFYEILSTLRTLEYLSITHLPLDVQISQSSSPRSHCNKLNLNQLKTLRIYKGMGLAPQFLEEFISSMPNMKKLILHQVYNNTVSAVLQILVKLGMINLSTLQISFTEILPCGPMNSQIKALLATQFQLEALQINVNSWEFFEMDSQELIKYYYSLLLKYADTLTDFKLTHRDNSFKDHNSEQLLTIPCMTKLKSLSLEHCTDFGTLDFLQKLPNLEMLSLGFIGPYVSNDPNDPVQELHDDCMQALIPQFNSSVVSNVKNLSLPSPFNFPSEHVENVLKMFPQLCKLTFKPKDNNAMYSLYKTMPHLQELEILQGSRISDYGLINGVHEKCTVLWSGGVYSILNLTRLKSLTIDGYSACITDDSVYYGFKHLKRLTSLRLLNCRDISSFIFEALKGLPLMHLMLTRPFPHDSPKDIEKAILEMRNVMPYLHIET